MTTSYKTALRDLMEILEDCVKFAAYHKACGTTAAASGALRTVIVKLDEMRALGHSIIHDFEQKKHMFDAESRKAWEEVQAQKIITLFAELAEPLKKLSDEERMAYAA